MTKSTLHSDYDKVFKKYNTLRNQMISTIEIKEYMMKHSFFNLKTDYLTKIGYLEYELYNLNLNIEITKRRIELFLVDTSQESKINLSYIESIIQKEFKNFFLVLNLKKKEIKLANYFIKLEKPSECLYHELRKYYIEIAKLLLPEINPEANNVHKKLWEKANKSYENGEVQFLKIIYKLANDEVNETRDDKQYTINELKKGINYFESRIKDLLEEINSMKDLFPFSKEELLKDDHKVKDIQRELKMNIIKTKNVLLRLEEGFLLSLTETRYLS